MAQTVDLNSDMGEAFGPWPMGDDAALLKTVTSANIACGFHAGDADTMSATMKLAVDHDVGIGAHPGFADLQGFGRNRMSLPAESLGNMVAYLCSEEGSWIIAPADAPPDAGQTAPSPPPRRSATRAGRPST